MTITPKVPMVVGRSRIERLRKSDGVNQVERDLVAEVRRRGQVRVVVFRGKNDSQARVWQFDPELEGAELEEAGAVMSQALLPLHRRLMASGVMIMVHTSWGARECLAMRHGVKVALARCSKGNASTPLDVADHWLLTHMLLHVALDTEHVTESLLPSHLALIDRRWARVRELVARMPPTAID